jgi:hypothetical protein
MANGGGYVWALAAGFNAALAAIFAKFIDTLVPRQCATNLPLPTSIARPPYTIRDSFLLSASELRVSQWFWMMSLGPSTSFLNPEVCVGGFDRRLYWTQIGAPIEIPQMRHDVFEKGIQSVFMIRYSINFGLWRIAH